LTKPVDILRQYWGYSDFRKPQGQVIDQVLSQKDVLAILPTGSGKSVIYQVSGLVLDGVSVVISPLIALIEDQVNSLNKKGIKSVALTGSLSFNELQRLLDNVAFGNVKFLFLSPERLQNEYVQKRLAEISVKLITVDEAHCISEWGHDFRPSFLKINILREIHPKALILALTATAKSRVVADIKSYLEMDNPVVFRESVFRPNIKYKSLDVVDKMLTISHLLDKSESGIGYVRTRKRTYQFAENLAQQGFTTGFFHGGMQMDKKNESLEAWQDNKVRMIFATNAFGMGIDKPDVRKVFHIDMPASLENYVQEAGRAGRDGKMSEAIMLVNADDLKYFESRYLNMIPSLKDVFQVYKALFNHFYIAEGAGKDAMHSLDYAGFCKRFHLDLFKTHQAMLILDSEELIKINQSKRFYNTIRILLNPEQIRAYIAHKRFGYEILNYLIRSETDIIHLDTKINLNRLAEKVSLKTSLLVSQLQEMHQREIVDFKVAGDDFTVSFLLDRDEYIFQQKKKSIQKRLQLKRDQLIKVLEYASNTTQCRSLFLSEYFEEENTKECGICDICEQKSYELSDDETMEKILELLQNNCLTILELQNHFPVRIDKYLDKLLDNNKILYNKDMKYCVKN